MRKSIIALAAIAWAVSASFATAPAPKANNSCCTPGAACCVEGAACCGSGASCCTEGASCCAEAAPCCK